MEKTLLYVQDDRMRAGQIQLQDITDKLNEIFGANILVQPSFLLSEVTLVNGTTAYQFPLLQTQIDNAIFPLSFGVNYNDVFVGLKREFTVDNRPLTTEVNIEVQKYYNKLVFTAANTSTPADIQSIFNANWNFQVGSKTYIQNQLTRKDLDQPRTQQSAANNWPSYSGNAVPDQVPYLVFSGKSTMYFNFLIRKQGFAGGGVNSVNVLSLYCQGFTLQNASGFAKFYTGEESLDYWMAKYEEANKGFAADKKQPIKASEAFANLGM
jgi:hypothetical protein